MWEWQSLLQIPHVCAVSGRMALLPSFLRVRLSAAAVIRVSSLVYRCCFNFFDQLQSSPRTLCRCRCRCRCRQPSYFFISQVMAAGGYPPQWQLTVEDVFWNATIRQSADMTQPSQSALSKHSAHTGKTNTRQDLSIGYTFY